MVGKMFPLHNLEILGDILINFEPLSKFINIFEEDRSIKKTKTKTTTHKTNVIKRHYKNKNKTQTTTYIYNVKLPMFLQTKV